MSACCWSELAEKEVGEGCFCRAFGVNSCAIYNFSSRLGSCWHVLRLRENHPLPGEVNGLVASGPTSYNGRNGSESKGGVLGPTQKQNKRHAEGLCFLSESNTCVSH